MGNNQPRYYNEKEAIDILGKHTAERLYQQLNNHGKYIDYHLFSQIILNQFDRIPKALCECIFYGFSSDLLGKVEIRLFISALAAIIGEPDQYALLKFLFRVYSAPGSYELERIRVEKILLLAYGTTLDKAVALKEVDSLFNGQTYLSQKDFELYPHPLPILSGWIKAVLTIYIEDLPPRLASLDRRYSAALESEQMMARYGVPKSTCDQLRQVYYMKCSSNGSTRGELTEECWIEWTSKFLPRTLARVIYRAKLDPPLKTVWRFVDFAEYCMIFGRSTLEDIASTLCVAFQHQSHVIDLSQGYDSSEGNYIDNGFHQEKKQRYTPLVSIVEMRRLLYLLSLPNAGCDPDDSSEMQVSGSPPTSSISIQTSDDAELHLLHNRYGEYLNPLVLRAISNIETIQIDGSAEIGLQSYVDLICNNASCFPGLLWLSITACCVFGLQPASPVVEKEYITELMLWKEAESNQSSKLPYGHIGTEWCVMSSEWWLKWSYYVGRSNRDEPFPPPIDNWVLLKKSSAVKQLLPNLILGTDFEIVFPEVFHAFQAWYGGGPKIIRKVIPQDQMGQDPESLSELRPVVELYPLCIRLLYCDEHGKYAENSMTFEQMWSKFAKIEDIVDEICINKGYTDHKMIHLWNIENKNWKKHYVLANELTLQQAGVIDGQLLLIERQLNNGIWPKSQLHSQIEADESRAISSSPSSSDSPLSGPKSTQIVTSVQINNGRVGLDNLGNTCYMNASLQALLHTNFLNEYFLTKLYIRDINKTNKHGYGGRLAVAYSSLVNDLWRSRQSDQLMGHAIAVMTDAMNAVTTSGTSNSPSKAHSQGSNGFVVGPSSVNPRKFRKEVGAIRDQFAGDDQHDAQELLAFLLDGLSEDLNLVQVKPYIEQPDSDDRPDHILADIWWDNHLQRDFSAIQSIFTGQFKSITTCKNCEYSSARYEPFNMLSVPLPEESMRSLVVYVLTLTGRYYCCSVRIPKVGTLKDVANEIKSYNLDGVLENSLFIPVLMVNYKIVNIISLLKSMDTIRDNDFLLFYQVKELPLTRSLPVVVSKDTLAEKSQKPLVGSRGRYGKISSDSENMSKILPEKSVEQPETQSSEIEKETSYDGDSDSGEDTDKRILETEGDNGLGDDFMHDIEGEIVGDSLKPEIIPSKKDDTIEVVFVHRRVKFTSVGGIEMFRMEQVGLPILEVFPVHVSAVEVYSLISKRVSGHLKSSISELAKSNLLSVNVVVSPTQSIASRSKKTSKDVDIADQLPRNTSNLSVRSESHGPSRIRPIATQDAIGGDIPPFGFVLRHVLPNGEFCSRCHWLSRCEGCIIPYDDEDTILTLDDGVTIAIDWHYVVYQEILDLQKSSEVIQHSSMKDHQSFHSKELPLEKCLQKFTEEEPLDDMVCPKCRNDNCLRRSFALWRLPPVLIIQLKRFQFNNYSRRKLTNFVNFPLEGLDMTEFLAPSARFLYSNTESEMSQDDETLKKIGTLYDLYSAVYHVGALGGGHYIATVRDMSEHLSNIIASYDESCHNLNSSSEKPPLNSPGSPQCSSSGQWWCYNDSTVTPVTSEKDIVSPSAYVLFYIRKDIQYSRLQDIHSIPPSIMALRNDQASPSDTPTQSDQEEKSTRTFIGESMHEAKNKLTKLMPPNITTRGGGGGGEDSPKSPNGSSSDPNVQSENQETCILS